MRTSGILLATEDHLSEEVGKKLLAEKSLSLMQTMGLKGNTYLKSKIAELNRSAACLTIFLLTDLDNPKTCPASLIQEWLPQAKNAGLIFRVAVVEIESWLLADRCEFARFIEVPEQKIPTDPDKVANPKETVVTLAKTSINRHIKTGVVPAVGGTARVGPQYNSILSKFVRDIWSPARASKNSPSLYRALSALDRIKT